MVNIKARALILKENKVFLLKTHNYILPGGTLESWETITETFYREMLEETWVNAIIDRFLWFAEYFNSKNELSLEYIFLVKNTCDFENILIENCSHWFEWDEAWFYEIEEIIAKKLDVPKHLFDLIEKAKNWWNFSLLI